MGIDREDEAIGATPVSERLHGDHHRERVRPLTTKLLGNRETLEPHRGALVPQLARKLSGRLPRGQIVVQIALGERDDRFSQDELIFAP